MKIKKHKPIQNKFLKIGLKTYKILSEKSPTEKTVKLIHIETKYKTGLGNNQPFNINLEKLKYEFVQDPRLSGSVNILSKQSNQNNQTKSVSRNTRIQWNSKIPGT